jgi:quercetin dioxygenase-like cupin family protein
MKLLRYGTLLLSIGAALLLIPIAGAEKDEMGFVRVMPEEVVWKELPGYGGVKFAVIEGDPSKEGIYVVRVKFPPGLMTRPHYHPEDRHAIVISGTWYTGVGDNFDPDKTVALKAGSYMKHPAKAHHFDGAKNEEVVLQIVGYGPSGTIMINEQQGHTGASTKKDR